MQFKIILVLIVAFLAGLEGILDAFHSSTNYCVYINRNSATGHLTEAIILGGSLQIIALAWANVGASTLQMLP